MVNYGMTFAAATHILTFQKAPAAILFMIIFNGVGAFNELSLANPFYQWGWAMPMAHAVMASRTIIFNGRDQVHNLSHIVAHFSHLFFHYSSVSVFQNSPPLPIR
mmetsp:Transcript_4779/g.14775  ORF Transcript_4779/g.14775 Transcript_4779/m.14775 type:complete len:105 (+) Transcript_4779:1258-1572(+)